MPMNEEGVIEISPLPKQRKAWELLLDAVTKYILFGGGAGGGKSWLICEWLLYMCYVYPGTKWFIGRKELKRLMGTTYATWLKVCKFHGIPEADWRLNGQYNYIEFKNGKDPKTGERSWRNGSRIDLLDVDFKPSDPLFERLGSTEYTGGALEEAGEIMHMAFDVLKSRVGRHMNKEYGLKPKILLTANPKKGWLKRLFYDPWVKGTMDKVYAFVRSLYSENRYTADEYGENLSEISNTVLRQRLKDGNWEYDSEAGTLVENSAIADLWTNVLEWVQDTWATLDVARFGEDTCVLMLWRGWNVYKIIVWKKLSLDVVTEKVKITLRDEKIPRSHLIIDEVGVGGGVLDNLKGAKGFIANATPWENPHAKPQTVMRNGELVEVFPRDNFGSLKDQCGYYLAEKINAREVGIDCEDENIRDMIEEELGCLRDKAPDEDKKKRLIPKDEMKEELGRSPDFLDALIMRVAFALNPPKDENDADVAAQIRANRRSNASDGYTP